MTTTKALTVFKPRGHSKLNPAMIQALSAIVAKGNYYVTACNLVGIEESTLYDWIERGRKDELAGLSESESLYTCLNKSLKQADAANEQLMVGVIQDAATIKKEWLPAITFLERRHRERWGRPAPITQINEKREVTFRIVYEPSISAQVTQGEVVEGEAIELPSSIENE